MRVKYSRPAGSSRCRTRRMLRWRSKMTLNRLIQFRLRIRRPVTTTKPSTKITSSKISWRQCAISFPRWTKSSMLFRRVNRMERRPSKLLLLMRVNRGTMRQMPCRSHPKVKTSTSQSMMTRSSRSWTALTIDRRKIKKMLQTSKLRKIALPLRPSSTLISSSTMIHQLFKTSVKCPNKKSRSRLKVLKLLRIRCRLSGALRWAQTETWTAATTRSKIKYQSNYLSKELLSLVTITQKYTWEIRNWSTTKLHSSKVIIVKFHQLIIMKEPRGHL